MTVAVPSPKLKWNLVLGPAGLQTALDMMGFYVNSGKVLLIQKLLHDLSIPWYHISQDLGGRAGIWEVWGG